MTKPTNTIKKPLRPATTVLVRPNTFSKRHWSVLSWEKNKQALTYLQRIKTEFAQSKEAELVDVQIGRLEHLN